GRHAPRSGPEVAQGLERGGRQVDLPSRAAHLVRILVELEVGVAQDAVVVGACGAARAAQDGADARDELLEAERLGDVVVSAHGQAVDRKSTRLNSSHVKISYAV